MGYNYLGTTVVFPIQVTGTGKVATVTGIEAVRQSIVSILTTPIGSVFMLRGYGSRITELTFEPNDDVLKDLLRLFIYEALQAWEKRTEFRSAEFNFSGAKVDITIKHRIIQSNEVDSFVFPFYRSLKY